MTGAKCSRRFMETDMADKYLRHKPTGIVYIWQPAFAQNPEFEELESLDEPKAAPKATRKRKSKAYAGGAPDTGGAGGEGDGGGSEEDTDEGDVLLIGSDLYPSMLPFGDKELALGDVVARAHVESGLSATAWNELDQALRDEAIMLTVSRLQAEADEAAQAVSEDASRKLP